MIDKMLTTVIVGGTLIILFVLSLFAIAAVSSFTRGDVAGGVVLTVIIAFFGGGFGLWAYLYHKAENENVYVEDKKG